MNTNTFHDTIPSPQLINDSDAPIAPSNSFEDNQEIEQPRGHLSSALCSTIINFIGSLSGGKKNSTKKMREASALQDNLEDGFPASPVGKNSEKRVVISITDSDVKEVDGLQEPEEEPVGKKEIIICEDSDGKDNKEQKEMASKRPLEVLSIERKRPKLLDDDFCECLSGKHESRQECLTERRMQELDSIKKQLSEQRARGYNSAVKEALLGKRSKDCVGMISEFNTEDTENSSNAGQERHSLPNNGRENEKLFEGVKETYSQPLPFTDGSNYNNDNKIAIEVEGNAGQKGEHRQGRTLSRGPQTRGQAANSRNLSKMKTEVIAPKVVIIKKIEVNRSQASKSKEPKEKPVPVLPNKKPIEVKPYQPAVASRQNSVKPVKNPKENNIVVPAPKKPVTRPSERSNSRTEVKKDNNMKTSRNSSTVSQKRNSLPNMNTSNNNPKKRKAGDVVERGGELKQVKKNNAGTNEQEKQKIRMFQERNPNNTKPARLMIERKTMEKVGGEAAKENEPGSGGMRGSKFTCVYCGGGLELKNSKMLGCLHRAHNTCYEAKSKKKNCQCPACNSNNAIGSQYKELGPVNSGAKKLDKKLVF